VLVVGAGPAGLEAARALGQRGYEVALADAADAVGGRLRHEAALPGLASWRRVIDHRLHLLRQMPRVQIYLQSRLSADEVLAFGFEQVVLATGATWRRDGLGRQHREALVPPGLADVFSPDDIFAGAVPRSPVLVYDDDHYVLGALLAERLARAGHTVHFMTPSTKVSEWTEMTMEQPRVQARLMSLGVHIHCAQAIVDVQATAGGLSVTSSSIYAPTRQALLCASLLLVTMRDPDDALHEALLAAQDRWEAAGVRAVRCIGDALAPGTVAAAVYAGHRAARELDLPAAAEDAKPFRRERIALTPAR